MKNSEIRLWTFTVLLGLAQSIPYLPHTFHISRSIYKLAPFLSHHGNNSFSNYLTMNLNFYHVAPLFIELMEHLQKPLITREEAHITVIAPPEFANVLSKYLTIDEIDNIARQHKIQLSNFKMMCLGKGQTLINNKTEETYFVVVRSEHLVEIREKIRELFVRKGGDFDGFDPHHFYSHITVGFTKRDLFERDGVIKDERSCWANIQVID